ncbi:MAG: flagellar hook-associated protein FlgL [Desulfatiglandaceae bacterium]
MRVTNKQMLNLVTRNVSVSSNKLLKAQERLSTLKVVNRPSDDPISMRGILDYRKRIASIDQYVRNIASAKTRVEVTESNLEKLHELLNTAKDIAKGSLGEDEFGRHMAAEQVGNLYDQIRDIGNARLGGSYIFAGHATDTLPFTKDEVTGEVTYNGDDGEQHTILGEGMTLRINAHGDEVFTGDGVDDGENIFDALKDLKDELESPVSDTGAIQDLIGRFNKGITQVERVLSQQSAAYKRLDQTEDYWNYLKFKFENVLSNTEGADEAQVTVELKAQETAYEMALASATNVLQRNLLDFLR